MQGRAFYDAVRSDARFEWLGVRSSEVVVAVRLSDEARQRCARHGDAVRYAAVFAIDVDEIEKHDWETFEAILTGKRKPKVMTWMTRIVGYYSNLEGWNRSKLAELRDRQKGDYAL